MNTIQFPLLNTCLLRSASKTFQYCGHTIEVSHTTDRAAPHDSDYLLDYEFCVHGIGSNNYYFSLCYFLSDDEADAFVNEVYLRDEGRNNEAPYSAEFLRLFKKALDNFFFLHGITAEVEAEAA